MFLFKFNHNHCNHFCRRADTKFPLIPLFSIVISTANYVTDDLNLAIFFISDSESIIPNVLCVCFFFSSYILVLTVFRCFSAAISVRRYEPKTLDCNPIQSNKFSEEQNVSICIKLLKFEGVRVPHWTNSKIADMTSLRQHFQNLRKLSSQIFVKIMWSKFHRNRSHSVQIKGCYRQTDRHTHTHTHTDRRTDRDRPGDNIFSNKMAEYKKLYVSSNPTC